MELINIPPLTYEEFKNIPDGTYVYNYGAAQCVALANQYHIGTLQGTLAGTYIQSAYQWWTDFNKYPALYEMYTQESTAQEGDVVVSKGGIYDATHGHIGFVNRSWNGSNFGTMEQGVWNGTNANTRRFSRNMANILGFLRPKVSPIPNPVPTPTRKKHKMGAFYRIPDGTIYYQDKPNTAFTKLEFATWKAYTANGNTYGDVTDAEMNSLLAKYGQK